MASHSYLVPDYYPYFSCKCGGCSHTCCSGWCITITMQKYFDLIGMECSRELRGRLDRAFCICDKPTKERYAEIVPKWDGDCPVHAENGFCALQAECGERILTEACRYYPRSMRSEYRYECSCANSCEAVVELLLFRREPISFIRKNLSFHADEPPVNICNTKKAHKSIEIRSACIRIIQDRTYSFARRMLRLGAFVYSLKSYLSADIKKLVSSIPDMPYSCDDIYAINILHQLIGWFEEYKPNSLAHEYFIEAQNYLGIENAETLSDEKIADAVSRYRIAKENFDKAYPDYDIMVEQIMVNHLFYINFPFSDEQETFREEFMSLCAVYAFIRSLSVCCYVNDGSNKKLVDVISVVFRLIEHSGFNRNTAILLNKFGCNTPERLAALVLI